MILSQINGKKVAVAAWGKDSRGRRRMSVFAGTAEFDGKDLFIIQPGRAKPFVVPKFWIPKLKPVTADLKRRMLESDYYIPAGDPAGFDAQATQRPSRNKKTGSTKARIRRRSK